MKIKRIEKEITHDDLTQTISVICQILYGTKEVDIQPLNLLTPKFVNDCSSIAEGLRKIYKLTKKEQ